MTGRFHNPTLLMAVFALSLLAGCQSRPHHVGLDRLPMTDSRGHARSLAMDSEPLHAATLSAGLDQQDAWYTGRYDRVRSVTDGYVSARHEQSITYTRDTQYISGGRVFDRYRESTYRRSTRESVR